MYLNLLTLLTYPAAILQHCHRVLIHLVVSLVPKPVFIALQQHIKIRYKKKKQFGLVKFSAHRTLTTNSVSSVNAVTQLSFGKGV